jgi:hypothetical protein
LAAARKTYRKNRHRRKAIFSLSLLLPFCMVFLVEMSCLIGKLPSTKSDCLSANLCHTHSEPVATTADNPVAETAHEDDHAHGSHHHHATHEHIAPPNDCGHEASDLAHEGAHSPSQEQSHTSCEGHNDHNAAQEVTKILGRLDQRITVLENCCIDDSVRFFSTPTYFQSTDAITLQSLPIVFCGLPREVLISFEEKTASFKPPENETLPTFSRLVRFQVFLI